MEKYLNYNGLSTFWDKIKNYIDNHENSMITNYTRTITSNTDEVIWSYKIPSGGLYEVLLDMNIASNANSTLQAKILISPRTDGTTGKLSDTKINIQAPITNISIFNWLSLVKTKDSSGQTYLLMVIKHQNSNASRTFKWNIRTAKLDMNRFTVVSSGTISAYGDVIDRIYLNDTSTCTFEGYLPLTHTNEINFTNTPSSGNIGNFWFNYRNGDTGAAADSDKLIKDYYFNDRSNTNIGWQNVTLHAGYFTGLSNINYTDIHMESSSSGPKNVTTNTLKSLNIIKDTAWSAGLTNNCTYVNVYSGNTDVNTKSNPITLGYLIDSEIPTSGQYIPLIDQTITGGRTKITNIPRPVYMGPVYNPQSYLSYKQTDTLLCRWGSHESTGYNAHFYMFPLNIPANLKVTKIEGSFDVINESTTYAYTLSLTPINLNQIKNYTIVENNHAYARYNIFNGPILQMSSPSKEYHFADQDLHSNINETYKPCLWWISNFNAKTNTTTHFNFVLYNFYPDVIDYRNYNYICFKGASYDSTGKRAGPATSCKYLDSGTGDSDSVLKIVNFTMNYYA